MKSENLQFAYRLFISVLTVLGWSCIVIHTVGDGEHLGTGDSLFELGVIVVLFAIQLNQGNQ